MSTATETQLYRFHTDQTPSIGDPPTSMITPILNPATAVHPSSLASITQEHRLANVSSLNKQYRQNPTPVLKNRNLLVAARLALRRQRAALRGPTLHHEPVRSETLQMELGNPDEVLLEHNRDTTLSPSLSNRTSPFRQESPQTIPADISLMFR